jgi:lysine 6-dehydrogenase
LRLADNEVELMKKNYAILGAGMQGTAAAYDLAKFADANDIRLGDASLARAEAAAQRLHALTYRNFSVHQVDALNAESLDSFLSGVDVLLSCVPYWMHPGIAERAIARGVNMCDLGGNTDITWQTLALDDQAVAAGVSLVPDCGLAPGLVNSLGMYLIESLDQCDSVKLYCGVLPQHPVPPFNYKLTFNIEGLVTEYDYHAVALRDGEIAEIETLTELESLDLPILGSMEAFVTSGGTSTAPYTLQGRVRNYEYKTIRFPGHCERMRIFKDFGFWNEQMVDVRGTSVRPKDVFCRVFGESLGRIQDADQCVIRGQATGRKNGENVCVTVDILDRQDPVTGFTAMERTTGFSLSIIAQAIAAGTVAPGAIRYETAMTGTAFMAEIRKRGIQFEEQRI